MSYIDGAYGVACDTVNRCRFHYDAACESRDELLIAISNSVITDHLLELEELLLSQQGSVIAILRALNKAIHVAEELHQEKMAVTR